MNHFWEGFEKRAAGGLDAIKPAQAMTNWKPAGLSTLGQRPIVRAAPPLPAFGGAMKGLFNNLRNQRLKG